MLDTIPKPKIPLLQKEEDDENYIDVEDENVEIPNTTELDEKTKQAFAGILGFICAIGLPEEIFSQKQQFYAEQAIELGVIDNIWHVIKTYFPDAEMSPSIALAISLCVFGMIVYSDRRQTIKEYKKRKQIEEMKKLTKKVQLQKIQQTNQNSTQQNKTGDNNDVQS